MCFFQFQRLRLSEKIPMVAVNSAEPRVSLFTSFVCEFLCCWVIQNELLELLLVM